MRATLRFLLLSAAFAVPLATFVACGTAVEPASYEAEPPPPPRPTMNHALHAAEDLECADCHDPDETGEPALPNPEFCIECHDDVAAEENKRVPAYFDTIRQEDGSYKFERPAYMAGLIVKHKSHAGYDVSCAECHGEATENAFARPDVLGFMNACMACHQERSAPNECATCHTDERKDKKPADHDRLYLSSHGKTAPEGWQAGNGKSCAICHSVPNDCNTCHTSVTPPSHREAGFRQHHGRGDTDVLDAPFKQTSCSLCHQEQSCQRCHATEQPRNHTNPFKRRLHGVMASVERHSCTTCHQQDWCMRCHQTTRPSTHRGNFGNGAQAHCMGCHDPLPSNGCYTCHKNTLGHLQATPLPAGAPHATATDCRTCHPILKHFDDGLDCRRCHR